MPPPYLAQDSHLISDLQAIEKKSPKLVRSSLYPTPADPNILVRSWKMNEFKYYDIPSPFPTLARGLFTTEIPESEYGVKHRIVVRGYDKFFNIGEVPWTTWEALEAHTAPPYTLSLKSNGCIIFIAALTPQKLIITSKHSLGPVQGVKTSHAEAGEQWVRRYLEENGKTEEQLATKLWEENWTAIAELCDDSFEEHVLPYPPDRTGLHLHGLNIATKNFQTMSHEIVDAFADEWGFIKTRTHIVNSITQVREFTNHIAEVGEWEGEAVEGFVVRTNVTDPPTESRKSKVAEGQSPYAPGSSFFFKVKFDEPYMMYRDWREVTKKLLTTKGPLIASILPKGKMKRKETKAYVNWVINEIKKNRKMFDGYTKGHGIIATRERFLKWCEENPTGQALEENEEKPKVAPGGKVIIVPVAIPGCGKTSVAIALVDLFGFGHTQSDDVTVKKAAPAFLKNVTQHLKNRDVVFADKNNHLQQHRQQLREVASKYKPPARLIALNWSLSDKPPSTIHQICSDRIINRGSNHQTLTANPANSKQTHENVLRMFIENHEELTGSEVDECIDMEIEHDLESMVKCAVDGLWDLIGGKDGMIGEVKPNEERIKEAVDKAKSYQAPKTKKTHHQQVIKDKKRNTPPRYYGLLPEIDLNTTLDNFFGIQPPAIEFWGKLKKANRVTKEPHITIVHQTLLPQEQAVWELSKNVVEADSTPVFRIKMGRVLWDERVMVFTVEGLELAPPPEADAQPVPEPVPESESESESGEEAGKEFIDGLPETTKERLHVTVGTASGSIPPVEGMKLVQRWRNGDKSVGEVPFGKELVVTGKLKGLWT